MNHYVLRTVSGAEYSFDGDSIMSFMGASSSLGEVYRIPQDKATLWIMQDKVESILEARIPEPHDEWAEVEIDCLDLSVRSWNSLRRAGINTVKDILDHVAKHGKLTDIRNFGAHCQCEVHDKLKSMYGLDMHTGEVTDGTDT